jgi:hypothetical protein
MLTQKGAIQYNDVSLPSFRRKPDCGGMDAKANIGGADGPQGEPQDAASNPF